ncbi:MAG: DUF1441 family protein [Rubrivivax sp.]|jgi:hypothetical protein|nr:DUF1441 family protein [Rubrivivax sp.]
MSADAAKVDTCTQAEFARRQGWQRSYVTRLKQAGRLVVTDDGMVSIAASLARIQASVEAPGRASAAAVSPGLRSDKERLAFYEAEKARLDLEERLGKLRSAQQVDDALADIGARLRSTLETWPERLTPHLASLGGDEQLIRVYLVDEIDARLRALSDMLQAAARAPGEADS